MRQLKTLSELLYVALTFMNGHRVSAEESSIMTGVVINNPTEYTLGDGGSVIDSSFFTYDEVNKPGDASVQINMGQNKSIATVFIQNNEDGEYRRNNFGESWLLIYRSDGSFDTCDTEIYGTGFVSCKDSEGNFVSFTGQYIMLKQVSENLNSNDILTVTEIKAYETPNLLSVLENADVADRPTIQGAAPTSADHSADLLITNLKNRTGNSTFFPKASWDTDASHRSCYRVDEPTIEINSRTF